ncbi:MAG: hypothetical protein ACN6PY_09060 [Paraburkholderia nemoris]
MHLLGGFGEAAELLVGGADELARVEAAIPPEAVAGSRYNEVQMAHLDSERSGH